MATSGKQVKDALGRKAVTVNNQVVGWESNADVAAASRRHALYGRFYLVKLGKKKYHLFEIG